MNKSTLIGLVLVFLSVIGLAFVVSNNDKAISVININNDRYYAPMDFEQLNTDADIIVLAKVIEGKENVYNSVDGMGKVGIGYTNTKLEIIDIYKGNTEEDVIVITEEYYTNNDVLYISDLYEPAMEGRVYLFFLRKYPKNRISFYGKYYPLGVEKGKYLIEESYIDISMSNISYRDFNINKDSDLEAYKKWYKEVFSHYKNSIMESLEIKVRDWILH